MSWAPGRHVIWRSRPGGAVGYTLPAIVVEDSSEVIALFQPAGTWCKRRSGERGGPRGRTLIAWDGRHADRLFDGPSTTRVHVPGTGFEVIRAWNGDRYEGWYINLVEPWVRTRLGFDTRDCILDVAVGADMVSWSWKDEDELLWARERGALSGEECARIRGRGRRALAMMKARMFPFDDQWSRLAPDGSWSVPVLPPDWDAAP